MLPSSLPHSCDIVLPLPDKFVRFWVRFRFQLIFVKTLLLSSEFYRFQLPLLPFSKLLYAHCSAQNWKLSVEKIHQAYCLDRYHKMGWLQPSLKVVYYNFFFCCSILVALCSAGARRAKLPWKNFAPFLTKSGHLAFKIVMKKGKNTKN